MSEEEENPLIEDNTKDANTPFPGIPAEMPGVLLEEDIPAIQSPLKDNIRDKTPEARAREAAANANFRPRETAIVKNHPLAEAHEERGDIVLRWQLNTKLHCRATFGSFCVAYDELTMAMNTQALGG